MENNIKEIVLQVEKDIINFKNLVKEKNENINDDINILFFKNELSGVEYSNIIKKLNDVYNLKISNLLNDVKNNILRLKDNFNKIEN